MFGIAKRGFGKALKVLKKDPTDTIKVKPKTKVSGQKPKLEKTIKPPKARMEYTIDVKDQEGKLIHKKEQVIGEKKRK